jgi:hypothetical protein
MFALPVRGMKNGFLYKPGYDQAIILFCHVQKVRNQMKTVRKKFIITNSLKTTAMLANEKKTRYTAKLYRILRRGI